MNHKEKLTDERIAQDLKNGSSPWRLIIISTSLLLLSGLLIRSALRLYVDDMLLPMIFLETIWSLLFVTIIIGFIAYDLKRIISWKCSANKRDFKVRTDTLVSCDNSRESMTALDLNFRKHKPTYYMHFKSFGTYRLVETTYYKWSSQYAMTTRGMTTYATPGDTYYIVTRDDKTILMVYNTKLFDYSLTKDI